MVNKLGYTRLKIKVSLFASMVPLRTFNIHGNFPFHRFLKCTSH